MESRLITMLEDDPFTTEQYRSICAKIFLTCGASEKKCILVTSAVPAEGKSLTTLNLAICIAQTTKEEVMVIDGDLRRPALHTLLGINPNHGCVNYFQYMSEHSNKKETLLDGIICQTGINNVSLLPAGEASLNPTKVLNSKIMPELIAELRKRQKNGYIFIDSPPVMPTSDPIILNQYVDWVILVVQAGKAPRKIIHKAAAQLESGKILGVVLNNLDTVSYQYTYGYKPYSEYFTHKSGDKSPLFNAYRKP